MATKTKPKPKAGKAKSKKQAVAVADHDEAYFDTSLFDGGDNLPVIQIAQQADEATTGDDFFDFPETIPAPTLPTEEPTEDPDILAEMETDFAAELDTADNLQAALEADELAYAQHVQDLLPDHTTTELEELAAIQQASDQADQVPDTQLVPDADPINDPPFVPSVLPDLEDDQLNNLEAELAGDIAQPVEITAQIMDTVNDIKAKTVVFELHIQAASFTKHVKPSEAVATGLVNKNSKVDLGSVKIIKEIITKAAMQELVNHKMLFRTMLLEKYAIPCSFLRGGMFLIPVALSEEVNEAYKKFRRERASIVKNKLLRRYNELYRDAEQRLGKMFNPQQFPTLEQLARSFGCSARFFAFDAPAALESFNEDLWKQSVEQLNVSFAQIEAEATTAYKATIQEYVNWMVQRLAPQTDGTRKGIETAKLKNMQEFLAFFEQRNITGNVELSNMIGKVKALMGNFDVEAVRKSQDLRASLGAQFAELKTITDQWVVDRTRFSGGEELI